MELTENSKLPFQRLEIVKQMSRLEIQILDYYCIISQVYVRHKQSLLKIMLNHNIILKSYWQLFHLEFEHLTVTFPRPQYPVLPLQSTISDSITTKF